MMMMVVVAVMGRLVLRCPVDKAVWVGAVRVRLHFTGIDGGFSVFKWYLRVSLGAARELDRGRRIARRPPDTRLIFAPGDG